jgi:hypothetical protein
MPKRTSNVRLQEQSRLHALVLICAVGAALLSFSSTEDAAAAEGAAAGGKQNSVDPGSLNGAREWNQRRQTMMDALLGAIAGLLISTLTRSNAVADEREQLAIEQIRSQELIVELAASKTAERTFEERVGQLEAESHLLREQLLSRPPTGPAASPRRQPLWSSPSQSAATSTGHRSKAERAILMGTASSSPAFLSPSVLASTPGAPFTPRPGEQAIWPVVPDKQEKVKQYLEDVALPETGSPHRSFSPY